MNDVQGPQRANDRQALLDTVAGIAEALAALVPADAAAGTLTAETVRLLEDAGLFRLKLPRVLGGHEADLATQFMVLEALARDNAAASWCTMVGATALALPGAFLPEAGIATMFPGGRVPRGAVIAMPAGKAAVVDGGFRLSGRWPFASGVRHSEWICAGAMVQHGDVRERRMMVIPTASAEIHDNWQVAGLEGTGSCDFSVDGLIVPNDMTWPMPEAAPQRGGPLYRIDLPGFVACEHAGFALGVARQALDHFTARETAKRRGFTDKAASLSARPAIQRLLGAADLRLRAARALALEVNETAMDAVAAGETVSVRQQGELRAVATQCTEVALDVVTEVFRYAGGGAIYKTNLLQQCLRDLNVAAQHLIVSDIAYENLGRMILGELDVNPMH